MEKVCASCKRSITGDKSSTSFFCPACGKVEVVRCGHCRRTAVPYSCPCGFVGP